MQIEIGDLLTRYEALDKNYQGQERHRPELAPTRFPGLDELLGGGVPLGYLISIEGDLISQTGKSGLGYLMSAAMQEKGETLWLDTNQDFNPDHAANCGMELRKVSLCSIREANHALRVIEKAIKSPGISCVVLDSIGGLIPRENVPGPYIMQLLSERLLALKRLCERHQTSLFIINQYKERPEALIGGPSTKCIPQIRLRVTETQTIKVYGVRVGLRSKVTSIKNPLTAPFKEWNLLIQYESGPDRCHDVIAKAIERGLIQRSGSWYLYQEQTFQGVGELKQALQSQINYLYQDLINQYAF